MLEVPEKMFNLFKDLIYKESGIYFYDMNRVVLESRLGELVKKYHCSLDEYYYLVTHNRDELEQLLDHVTTNLTRLFRNEGNFNALRNFVIPALLEKKEKIRDKVFNFWSAGCSTGEECYSVAMVLSDMLPKDYKIRVVGSDLSLSSLKVANEGLYSFDKMKDVPSNYITRFFNKEEKGYRVNDYLKSLVRFDYHNLNFPSTYVGNDLVFCRNVLIYFDQPTQERVVNNIWETMKHDTYLFIGHSESLLNMNTKFEFVSTKDSCFYKKN